MQGGSQTPLLELVTAADGSGAQDLSEESASPRQIVEVRQTDSDGELCQCSLSRRKAVEKFWMLEDSNCLDGIDEDNGIGGLQLITQMSDGTVTPDSWAATGVGEWERFRSDVHPQIMRWSTPWGGVSAWSETFEVLFQTACRVGARFTDKHWLKKIWGHASVGKQLLALLRHTNLPLPEDPEAIRLLWTKKMDDAELLIKGIAVIETRFDILGRGMFSVPGDPVDDDSDVEWERPLSDFVSQQVAELEDGDDGSRGDGESE